MQTANLTITLFKIGAISLGVIGFEIAARRLPWYWHALGFCIGFVSFVILIPDFVEAFSKMVGWLPLNQQEFIKTAGNRLSRATGLSPDDAGFALVLAANSMLWLALVAVMQMWLLENGTYETFNDDYFAQQWMWISGSAVVAPPLIGGIATWLLRGVLDWTIQPLFISAFAVIGGCLYLGAISLMSYLAETDKGPKASLALLVVTAGFAVTVLSIAELAPAKYR
jgi:hypothetical protein